VCARGGGTHLGVGDVQRYRLAARAVRAGPPAEGDLVVDQLVELVVIVVAAPAPGDAAVVVGPLVVFILLVVIVVVVPRFADGGPGVPRLLHLGERQHRLTPGTLRGGAQQRGALCVSSLEPVPAQALLRVLVVEQKDQPVRGVEAAEAITSRGGRGEVPGEAVRQVGDRPGSLHVRLAVREQVERQRHPVPGLQGLDLVTAVRVERNERQLLPRHPVRDALAAMLHDQFPARMRRRQRHHQRAHHRVGLLRVLMRQEKLSLPVHQHRVQLGPQLRRGRQPQLIADVVQHGAERCLPGRAAQPDKVRRDLPRVTNGRVGQRLLAAPEHRRPRHRDQLLRERRTHRRVHRPDTIDLDLQRVGWCQDLRAERPGRLRVVQQLGQPFPCRATHEALGIWSRWLTPCQCC
jgi:hypothetical protein